MAPQQERVLEGTWEEIALYAEELKGQRVRLTIVTDGDGDKSELDANAPQAQSKGQVRQSAMGKYAGVLPSSEEFMREKQEEIDREDRRSK